MRCLRTNPRASSRLKRVFFLLVFSVLPGGQLTAIHNPGEKKKSIHRSDVPHRRHRCSTSRGTPRLASMSAAADTFWPFLDARDDDDDDDGGTTNAGGGDFNGVGALDGPDALVRHGRCA